jgi:hypothetical protein
MPGVSEIPGQDSDLVAWQEICREKIMEAYQASMHVVAGAVEILKD